MQPPDYLKICVASFSLSRPKDQHGQGQCRLRPGRGLAGASCGLASSTSPPTTVTTGLGRTSCPRSGLCPTQACQVGHTQFARSTRDGSRKESHAGVRGRSESFSRKFWVLCMRLASGSGVHPHLMGRNRAGCLQSDVIGDAHAGDRPLPATARK